MIKTFPFLLLQLYKVVCIDLELHCITLRGVYNSSLNKSEKLLLNMPGASVCLPNVVGHDCPIIAQKKMSCAVTLVFTELRSIGLT